jgi:hypothetical protein
VIAYIESSAAAKLLVSEAASAMLADYLDQLNADGSTLISCVLLETELRRLAVRDNLQQLAVTALLDRLDVIDLDREIYREAGLLPERTLRSLDAIHVAAALRAGSDVMVTYDVRQAAAAESSGLRVVAPGAE